MGGNLDIRKVIGRERMIIVEDIERHAKALEEAIRGARVLIYGGAGSIGKEVAIQIFKRNPRVLHVVDIAENDLVELVRELRSSLGYISGETRFLPIDMGSVEAAAFLSSEPAYDYILNLAAMKHVRTEKDAYSLMRMIKVNVLDTFATFRAGGGGGTRKYFAVSTDKATNPVNLMGATKRIMEDVLFKGVDGPVVSTARFANVAFSNGSLLHGFRQRLTRSQPLSAPRDVRRYFVTGEESGLLCLASLVLGKRREIFFPKLDPASEMATFSDIAVRFLAACGYEAVEVASEAEARSAAASLIAQKKWPCYFFNSDTAGEKAFEEFHSDVDEVDWTRFSDIGVISAPALREDQRARLAVFVQKIEALRAHGTWTKAELVEAIRDACPELIHADAARFLDEKM
jgi:FlaA1/EpsC-like NDP-sugar epimerase